MTQGADIRLRVRPVPESNPVRLLTPDITGPISPSGQGLIEPGDAIMNGDSDDIVDQSHAVL